MNHRALIHVIHGDSAMRESPPDLRKHDFGRVIHGQSDSQAIFRHRTTPTARASAQVRGLSTGWAGAETPSDSEAVNHPLTCGNTKVIHGKVIHRSLWRNGFRVIHGLPPTGVCAQARGHTHTHARGLGPARPEPETNKTTNPTTTRR